MSLSEYEAKIDSWKHGFLDSQHGAEWIAFVKEKDPALKSVSQESLRDLLIHYPGLTAIVAHEHAYKEQQNGNKVEALAIADAARALSGIEIHPQTDLHWRTFIDHGSADVIGGDVHLGEGAMLYSNVVLGNFNGERDDDGHRHPQIGKNAVISTDVRVYGPCHIGDDVRIHPGAQIISTDIGNNVVIGPNVVLNHADKIPDHSYVSVKGQELVISALADKQNSVAGAPKTLVDEITHWGRTKLHRVKESLDEIGIA